MEGTKTLKQAKIGEKVTVVKLTGEGAVKRRNHGYGHHQRHRDFYQKSSASRGSCGGYRQRI